jgi:hypothetical protein
LKRSERSKVCLFKNLKAPSEATSAYSRNRQDRSEKTNGIKVKQTEAVFLKVLWKPGIDSEELFRKFQRRAGIFK